MRRIFQRVHRSASAWSLFSTVLRVGANVFVLPLVLHKIAPDDLAMWYVFGAIGGLSILLDLGFEQTVTRMTAYAWGGATKFIAFGIHQDESRQEQAPNLALLRDLVATLRAYYFYTGLAVLLLLGIGGTLWIWIKTAPLSDADSLRVAWGVYAISCWLSFVVGRWPALLSGVGAVREAQQASIWSLITYYVVAVTGLLCGLGIWALVAGAVSQGFVARHQGRAYFKKQVPLPGGLPPAHFHWEIFQAIWPNAWRTGMVAFGSFMTVRASTLICSAYLSLKVTAAYGLSFQLIDILFQMCNVWVMVRLPYINTLRQQGRTHEIEELFARRVRLAMLSYVAGMLAILFLAPHMLLWIKSKTALMAMGPLMTLAVVRLLELHQSLYAFLVLTENRNPFMMPSLISGAAIVLMATVLTAPWGLNLGVMGLILAMGVVQLGFNDWWPVLRGLRGLGIEPRRYLVHHYLRPRAWIELF